jgi:hypothetical protein
MKHLATSLLQSEGKGKEVSAGPSEVSGFWLAAFADTCLFQPEALCVDTHVLNTWATRHVTMHWLSTGDHLEVKRGFPLGEAQNAASFAAQRSRDPRFPKPPKMG